MTDQKPECECPARRAMEKVEQKLSGITQSWEGRKCYGQGQAAFLSVESTFGQIRESAEAEYLIRKTLADPCPCCKERDELAAEHERLLAYARKVKGSRDVHSVYEVLDCLAAERDRLLALMAEAKEPKA